MWMMEVERKARLYNQEKLRALSCDRSSHDAIELKSLTEENHRQFVG